MTAVHALSAAAASLAVHLTLCAAVLFAVFRVDDLAFNLLFWFHALRRKYRFKVLKYPKFTIERLRSLPQKRAAIFVPCWHEADVVEQMLECAKQRIDYENYDIFVGVYPNDPQTVAAVESAQARYPRVRMVINDKPGPTTKAQNLNCMYRALLEHEGAEPYEIVVLHDVEDVIHPWSLHVYNYLVPASDMVQLPVLPLEREWYRFVAWTYGDEFAQNHMKDMVLREAMGSFVPSAGVGCAFSRVGLAKLQRRQGDALFPEGSLTEDYQTALRMHECGLRTIFVLQRLCAARRGEPKTADAYIATRAYFPDTFWTAVKQKTRWVAGISLQSWKAIGWTGDWATRYTLYRDRKSTAGNVIPLFGYAAFLFAAAVAALHAAAPDVFAAIPTDFSPAVRALLLFVLAMTLADLLQTAALITWVYGPLHGFLCVLRAPVGACINGVATVRALVAFFRSLATGTPMTWSKTAHAFPTHLPLHVAGMGGMAPPDPEIAEAC